ncbi:MAG: glucose-6-phosphate isomerase [Candidatus Ancillula sp.]|jgi:glucose-6-phosphate isomerase|nr:glucose-6-phosphate isomerase [Candidatus Ancillula sp.]
MSKVVGNLKDAIAGISKTKAWKALQKEYDKMENFDLRTAFEQDPDRAKNMTFDVGDLHIDISKNLIKDSTLKLFEKLAEEVNLKQAIEDQFTGKHINNTEDRPVLHTALRYPESEKGTLIVDGQDVIGDAWGVLNRVFALSNAIRSGEKLGVTGKKIKTIVNIGIGGSDLGSVMVYEALRGYANSDITARFVSNIDPTDISEKLKDLDPATTLFIVCSKTFTTLETLTNARLAKKWLLDNLRNLDVDEKDTISKHFVAISTALNEVKKFGISPDNTFGFWNWVGGRYSVESAIGANLAIIYGEEVFREFLSGFHVIDKSFRTSPFNANPVVTLAMLNIWYVNFYNAHSHAILPYAQYLHRFPAFLQQLTMESNGKTVRADGSSTDIQTGEIFWGEPGTNGQHAFYQLIHQGTRLIPADFIAAVNPTYALKDDDGSGEKDVHELFLANFLAQTKALAFGKTKEEVAAEGTPQNLVNAKVFDGNRPTTSIIFNSLTPAVVGSLIALYEQITFVQGIVWGLNSFDQWGVQLGKVLALEIFPALSIDDDALNAQDSSTRALIEFYRKNRE